MSAVALCNINETEDKGEKKVGIGANVLLG